MAWKEHGLWVAVCLDFSLAAQGNTLQDAKDGLHGQVLAYVNEAMTVDAEHARELLLRRAPLVDRLRYAFWMAVHHRPRLRRTARLLIQRIGLAIQPKSAYSEPLPLRVA